MNFCSSTLLICMKSGEERDWFMTHRKCNQSLGHIVLKLKNYTYSSNPIRKKSIWAAIKKKIQPLFTHQIKKFQIQFDVRILQSFVT